MNTEAKHALISVLVNETGQTIPGKKACVQTSMWPKINSDKKFLFVFDIMKKSSEISFWLKINSNKNVRF